MSDQNVNLSVSDPISGDIQAIAKGVEATMNFLCSPEGQLCCKSWRESSAAWNAAVAKGCAWIENLIAGKK